MRALAVAAALLAALLLVLKLGVGPRIEAGLNRVTPVALPEVSERARALHFSSDVVDMHADSLLFGRDLLERSDVGHVDLPRLQEGGVAIQFLTLVTVSHAGTNADATDPDAFDMLTLMGIAQLNGFAVKSPLGRALLQADRWRETIARSEEQLWPIRDQRELENLVARHRADPRTVGTLLGVEGAHALNDDVDNFDALFDAGVRMIGHTHFFDNAFAGSAHGLEKGGLTEQGELLLERMLERGVLIDLAHLSPVAVSQILDRADVPTVVSHGGVQATCPGPRNLSDEQIRRIAAGGGVIGVGYFEFAVCGRELSHVLAAMRHIADLVGADHVGLGSDYDGGTNVGFDTSQLPALTQALLDGGFSEQEVRGILGENVLRVLRQVLPEG
jgi:microsomal dipeptidase-like Zn-dependent dipeptidase